MLLVTAQNFSKIVGVTGGKTHTAEREKMGKTLEGVEQIMIVAVENRTWWWSSSHDGMEETNKAGSKAKLKDKKYIIHILSINALHSKKQSFF